MQCKLAVDMHMIWCQYFLCISRLVAFSGPHFDGFPGLSQSGLVNVDPPGPAPTPMN